MYWEEHIKYLHILYFLKSLKNYEKNITVGRKKYRNGEKNTFSKTFSKYS